MLLLATTTKKRAVDGRHRWLLRRALGKIGTHLLGWFGCVNGCARFPNEIHVDNIFMEICLE